ncbi:hypothetical protein J2852_005728 [Azospirillum soli]|nr:hypothetical protein [Azospirillum soli]
MFEALRWAPTQPSPMLRTGEGLFVSLPRRQVGEGRGGGPMRIYFAATLSLTKRGWT